MKNWTVYGLSQQGQIMYVGLSCQLAARLREHRRLGIIRWDQVEEIECRSERQAQRIEHEIIVELEPPYNFTHNPRWAGDRRLYCETLGLVFVSEEDKYRQFAQHIVCALAHQSFKDCSAFDDSAIRQAIKTAFCVAELFYSAWSDFSKTENIPF